MKQAQQLNNIPPDPQRWYSRVVPWLEELVLQNMKNVVKRFVVR